MAMTVNQAQQIVDSTIHPDSGPPDVGAPNAASGPGTSSDYRSSLDLNKLAALGRAGINPFDPNTSDEEIASILYSMGLGGVKELEVLKNAGLISATDTSNELGIGPGGSSAGPYGGGITDKQINDAYARVQAGTGTFADKVLLDRVASDKLLYGGAGGSSASAAAQLQYDYATLEEKKREFGLTFPEQQREFDLQQALAKQQAEQGYLQNRASTGLQLGDLTRGLANDQYQRALDPGNYPAYLAASAGLPQGTGSPISALIGQGTQIQSPEGANPLADPRFQNLIGNLYDYAQPGALQTVQGLVQPNGQLPQAFYDYTHTQNPNAAPAPAMNKIGLPGFAQGGSQMLNGPVVGIPESQIQPGQDPQFLAGEAGPEMLHFQPMHGHAREGMPLPHQHQGGHASHEHLGPVIRYADGGTVVTGTQPTIHQLNASWNAYHGPEEQRPDTTFTPAEGTAISLGKALQPLGYVPSYLTQQLMEGRTPTPGSIDEATLSRLPPSLRALLQAQIRSALGSAGLQDYNAQLQTNALPGLNNGGMTNTIYGG